jgi:hypothetical protein
MNIPLFTVGVVLLFIALLGGNFKILGAEITGKSNKFVRLVCSVIGVIALFMAFNINPLARMQAPMLDVDLPGGDISTLPSIKSSEECASKCQDNSKCQAYTFKPSESRCFLKGSDHGGPSKSGGLVSGLKK